MKRDHHDGTRAQPSSTSGKLPTHSEIEREAYFLWERSGRPAGRDREFWQEAELQLCRTKSQEAGCRARTILLVDDEPLCRHFMALFLRYEGYVVMEASSGEEARRMMESGCRTDLLVTDFQMQGINGEELVTWLHEQHPDIPALLVSGLPDIQDRVQLNHPNFRCMTKSGDPDELTEAVALLLN